MSESTELVCSSAGQCDRSLALSSSTDVGVNNLARAYVRLYAGPIKRQGSREACPVALKGGSCKCDGDCWRMLTDSFGRSEDARLILFAQGPRNFWRGSNVWASSRTYGTVQVFTPTADFRGVVCLKLTPKGRKKREKKRIFLQWHTAGRSRSFSGIKEGFHIDEEE